LMKAGDLLTCGATGLCHVFRPAMEALVQYPQDAKWGMVAPRIEPGKQLLKMQVDCQRARFIDQAQARRKLQEEGAAPTLMEISDAAGDLAKLTRLAFRGEHPANLLPI